MPRENMLKASSDIAVVEDIHFYVHDSGYIGAVLEVAYRGETRFEKIPNTSEFLRRDFRIGDRLTVNSRGVISRRVNLEARSSVAEVVQLPDHCPQCGEFLDLEFERKPQLKCRHCSKGTAMIEEVTGDVIKDSGKGDVIGIPVNTQGVAGKGLALTMRTGYAATYKEYRKACKRGRIATGDLTVVEENGKRLALIPTKYEWRNPSVPDLIEVSLIRLKKYLQDNRISECHLPKLGCGSDTGQLDYLTVVKPIIRKVFTGSSIRVVVYG